MKRLAPLALLAVFAAPAWSADPAPAAPAPEKVVVYREKMMKAAADHMATTGMIVKGEIDRPQDLAAHATALAELGKTFGSLFPAGTGPDKVKSESRPEVWSQPEKFAEAAKVFETESAKLAEVAKTNDLAAFKAQFGKVGEACGGCHDSFREEDH
jgi:cytochrome c556